MQKISRFKDMATHKKYSIIIPAKNGMPYLEYAVRSALATDRLDLEVLVSLDMTGDESKIFLDSISDERLRVVYPSHGLSMSEHWDFAQLQAKGRWQIFLGQDDMLLSGYPDMFDSLTRVADESELEIVVSRRAYITWPPLANRSLKPLQYWRTDEISVLNSRTFARSALLSEISYHEGPQMYTTTLVYSELLAKIRRSNGGRLIGGHPQDAYLAAELLKHSRSYLWSGSPFGWVGTSNKSAGLAITHGRKDVVLQEVARSYVGSISGSERLPYHSNVDFRHGVNARYFYDALRIVWPEFIRDEVASRLWYEFQLDVNLVSSMTGGVRGAGKYRALVCSPKFLPAKVLSGLILRVWRSLRSLALSVIGVLAKQALGRRFRFVSVYKAKDIRSLYEQASEITST